MSKNNSDMNQLFPINNYDQKLETWINPNDSNHHKLLLNKEEQKKKFHFFCENYFGNSSKWNQTYIENILNRTYPNDIKSIIFASINKFSNQNKDFNEIGYGWNFRPHTLRWIENIEISMNIEQLNNLKYDKKNRCIAVDNLQARILPTLDVHFYDSNIGGQGFPFDNLQESCIYLGTPLYIIAMSNNSEWSLIIAHESISWVQSKYIARVDDDFIKEWKHVAISSMIAITKSNTSIFSINHDFLLETYIGSIFPSLNDNIDNYYTIIIPIKSDNIAIIKYALVSKDNANTMPLPISPSNISNIISLLSNLPYGWGNLYFYNDCSSELKNLFTPFGIFLPRNSYDQISSGYVVDLSDNLPNERINYLLKNGKPFLTIIYIENHVFLYIGNHKNTPMTYQNIWGLRSKIDKNIRYIIGSSVFLPLLLSYDDQQDAISLAMKKYFKIIYL